MQNLASIWNDLSISEHFIKSPEHLAKQGISEQKGVIEIYDKNFIRLPRQQKQDL